MSHDERLLEVAEMVASGSLTVRQASPDERLRFGIVPATEEPCYGQFEGDELGEPGPVHEQHLGGMDERRGPTASQRAALIVQREAAAESSATAAELAAAVGVSTRTVERAQRVQEGDPALFQKLVEGRVSATKADKAVSARMEEKGG
jgi:hypothetical protein